MRFKTFMSTEYKVYHSYNMLIDHNAAWGRPLRVQKKSKMQNIVLWLNPWSSAGYAGKIILVQEYATTTSNIPRSSKTWLLASWSMFQQLKPTFRHLQEKLDQFSNLSFIYYVVRRAFKMFFVNHFHGKIALTIYWKILSLAQGKDLPIWYWFSLERI